MMLLLRLLLLVALTNTKAASCTSPPSRSGLRRCFINQKDTPSVCHRFFTAAATTRRRTAEAAMTRTTTALKESSFSSPFSEPVEGASSSSSSFSSSVGNKNVFKTTALAIVPPDDAWDTIQRARHFAGDPSYQQWPPCLRLFYYHQQQQEQKPKKQQQGRQKLSSSSDTECSSTDSRVERITDDPLQIASVIDKYQIEPFPVRLNRWSVLPHAEVIWHEKQEQQQQQAAQSSSAETSSSSSSSSSAPLSDYEKLVAQEEEIGRRRLKRRLARKAAAQQAAAAAAETDMNPTTLGTTPDVKKQESVNDEQYEESEANNFFNGPCVICLEPDTASKQRISELRQRILQELIVVDDEGNANDASSITSKSSRRKKSDGGSKKNKQQQHACSPTATVTPLDILCGMDMATSAAATTTDDGGSSYRPVVPIGSFSTVDSAIEFLGHLKALWEPLEFDVTDLQVLSCRTKMNSAAAASVGMSSFGAGLVSSSKKEQQQEQVGCDALIMLQGEEVVMDDELNAEMANLIATQGQAGGALTGAVGGPSSKGHSVEENHTIPSSLQEPTRIDDLDLSDGDVSSLQDWLRQEEEEDERRMADQDYCDSVLNDDDADEGTVVVLGRTHFFTGDMRTHVGMPAESIPLRSGTSRSSRNKNTKSTATKSTAHVIVNGEIAAASDVDDKNKEKRTTSTEDSSGTV